MEQILFYIDNIWNKEKGEANIVFVLQLYLSALEKRSNIQQVKCLNSCKTKIFFLNYNIHSREKHQWAIQSEEKKQKNNKERHDTCSIRPA